MSGGTDSSVAAALLVEQGYNVFGVMLNLWKDPASSLENNCCGIQNMIIANKVCNQLAIPFYVLDARKKFYDTVVNYYVNEYEAGNTPNPCVICNQIIRFDWLLAYAKNLGADFVATGHYVQRHDNQLFKGMDPVKDQTYMLWALKKEVIPSILFPVGGLNKSQVKELATKYNLPLDISKESQGICFIPNRDNRAFLESKTAKLSQSGPILDIEGREIGTHTGLLSYTVGQRHRIPVNLGYPVYVLKIDVQKNALIVGPERYLYKKTLLISDINWLDMPRKNVNAQIRYHHQAQPATIHYKNQQTIVNFAEPVRAITPGQSIVFYEKNQLLGGGIIEKALEENPNLNPRLDSPSSARRANLPQNKSELFIRKDSDDVIRSDSEFYTTKKARQIRP